MARAAQAAEDLFRLRHEDRSGAEQMNKYNPGLIYDVGMNNGDDTAYYLRRGFRVVAIEPNPALVATACERFRREIEAGELTILDVGVAAADGELPFWVCLTDSRLSSFDRRDASLDDRQPVEEIRVPCRTFRSILDEFGVPFYLKVDIQGNDSLCVEALDPGDVPKFLSVEFALWDAPLMALMRARGFNRFKYISQTYFLPLQLPPLPEARLIQRAERLSRTRNMLVRVFRRLGGRRWIQRQFDRLRTHDGWMFPAGSSGPFGDELRGRWLGPEELHTTAREFLRLRQEAPQTLSWALAGLAANPANPFWADLHARSE
jgi:FkbM family methyltransferase